jgi:cbb3-type cytochrome oxidase cytochrome c subunit
MAATDKNYRDQYTLDIVFAVTSILMLISIVWMFMQDYNREYKDEQRSFRDVEAALAQRQALDQMPSFVEFDNAQNAVDEARAYRNSERVRSAIGELEAELSKAKENNEGADKIKALETKLQTATGRLQINQDYRGASDKIGELLPKKERSEQAYNSVKADLDSISSFYDIEVDEHSPNTEKAKKYFERIAELRKQVADAQAAKDDIVAKLKDAQAKKDAYEAPLTEAISTWKKITDKFDAQVALAIKKQWRVGDFVRSLPVLDSFAPPIKIHQFTINDVPIDYNFKYVTRFDRCMSCHQGIDRPNFAKSRLKELTRVSSDYDQKLADAHEIMKRRGKALKGLPENKNLPKWNELELTKVSKSDLTEARVNEYCAHPRLDLFVGSNSKHPAEKFGCTSCHAGQGSATSFTLASHTPNTPAAQKRWEKEHDWEAIHMWDFPMQPTRFVESSCLKCHHQVTDLIGSDNRNEAPKLVRGFNLIKENGCFGCHEIAGRKGGRQIGPDLRLEPNPPLESLTPSDRAKIEADVDNPPGNMRKVGPSLYRLKEKTNPEWVAKWLRAPRGFRPDTKMPHFYGVSNNHPDVLPENQKQFPDTEIWAITHFLFEASEGYLKEIASRHKDDAATREKDQAALAMLQGLGRLTDQQKKELDDINRRIQARNATELKDLMPAGHKANAANGRLLFSERGCLACHSHHATETAQGKSGEKDYGPAMMGEALFGPNLSQIVGKLGTKKGDKASARTWLIQWVLQPQVHSPRSRMPVTHLTPAEAADVAEWLLSQKALDEGPEWAELAVREPNEVDLRKLAEVYLVRILSRSDMDAFIKDGKLRPEVAADLPVEEKELAQNYNEEGLKRYLGKKAVGRLGCYACHDIPGYDNAKPIGVALNDWGKKDPGRLAFEDINSYLEHHFQVVSSLVDREGNPMPPREVEEHGHKVKKMPYEKFYAEALEHRHREGFLNQKLVEPRSYDYNRLRAWDDRLRMPQFRFARSRRHAKESDEEFEARANKEEADAREAVMTFILGLVADPVPFVSINQPTGDRLVEIKGRQVLDKFNCGGCHLIRPGAFDFRVSKETIDKLEVAYKAAQSTAAQAGDHFFGFHSDWVGKNPAAPDKLTAMAVRARVFTDEDDPSIKFAEFRLTRALRFQDSDRRMKDIPSAKEVRLSPRDMLYPPAELWENNEKLQAFLQDKGPFGGRFADLLVDYLVAKDKSNTTPLFTRDGDAPGADSGKARAAVPPILLGQGERTQSDWLYQFLLNPQPIRKMVVLRMPKFNMSPDEARALVDYFAAVERLENPGIGLKAPYETIPQQEPLSDLFWTMKNTEYIARLRAGKMKDVGGKDVSLYENRLEELQPIWQQIFKDLQARESEAKSKMESMKSRSEAAKKAEDAEKDMAKKGPLEAARKKEEEIFQAWEAEWKTLAERLKKSTPEEQRKTWETEEAYVTDAFRLVANKQLCMQCHQVSKTPVNNQIQGPPLYLAFQRLRPGWLERWIATPQRFLTYGSSMPINFPQTDPKLDKGKVPQYQEFFAGSPSEQVAAIRDMLMAYPQAMALPVNHFRTLPLAEDAKTGGKK